MEVVQVQPRDSYLHNIYVATKGTVIRWSFTTKRNNISFGLYRRKEKEALPNSSDIIFRAQQQLQKRQMSIPSDLGFSPKSENGDDYLTAHDDDIESNYVHSSAHSIHSQTNTPSRPRSKSVATIKLKERGLDEIIPIQHAQSCDQKVEGTYVVEEPGNYVLVFDNTFSRNTPKMLTYSVALGGPEEVQPISKDVSGWLLKKKRKRMQGWAKRWFSLSPSGVLSYSTSQGSVTRGSIQILVSTISYNPKLRQIHIDSGTMIYHLKTLTESDYDLWCAALRDIRTNVGDEIQSPIVEEYNNKSSVSLASKRLSSRGFGNQQAENKKMRAEIDHGIESANLQQQNVDLLLNSINELKLLVPASDNVETQDLFDRLEQQKLQVLAGIQEQISQWQNVQNCFGSSRRSGSISPIVSQQPDGTIPEYYPTTNLGRSSSIYSRNSGYSDQFFDAEDIDLSGGEEEDIDQNSTIDDGESSDDEAESSQSSSSTNVLDLTSVGNCTRRAKLPSPAVADPGSALSVFRKNVGKDLSTIAMPISMNEPLNMLQKACEELEYSELLDKASTLEDALDRLLYVTVFSISSYASSQYRTGRKPFNPMMTETYENIRPDRGFRFISEKVSHNPLIIAAHAESKGFKYWQSTTIKSKFWGKSMEFMTEGTFHVTLTGHDDHFTFFKPSSWMKNMIAGEKYLEHSGECKVTNQTTGDYAVVTFKEGSGGGLFGAPTKRNDVVATLYNAQGKKCRRIVGKWSESLAEEVGLDKNKLNVLWTAQPPGIQDSEKYFGFTKFATELNEITEIEEGKIPITDTRLRPDQVMYEKGLVDEADDEKQRIEQKQRDKRKEFELAGKEWTPRWFAREGEEWQYAGQYWPTRESGQWPKDQFELW